MTLCDQNGKEPPHARFLNPCQSSGSEAGSYLRLIYFVYHSTLGLRVITKRRRRPMPGSKPDQIIPHKSDQIMPHISLKATESRLDLATFSLPTRWSSRVSFVRIKWLKPRPGPGLDCLICVTFARRAATRMARRRPMLWVVRVEGDDRELRPWHYIYVYSIESRLIMRVRYDSHMLGLGPSPRPPKI